MSDTTITQASLESLTFPCTVYELYGVEYDSDSNCKRWGVRKVRAVGKSAKGFTINVIREVEYYIKETCPANWFYKSEEDARLVIRQCKQEYTPPYEDLVGLWRMLLSEAENKFELDTDYVTLIVNKAKELLPPED
jgi:hypothetical protein